MAESDSADAESGFEEADPGEAGVNVIKMVSRFVDKVFIFCFQSKIHKSIIISLDVLGLYGRGCYDRSYS